MKLYNSTGPNPRVVRMFLAEKGVDLPVQTIDVRGGENRREPYLSTVNARGQCPALELDDGSHLCEITAICEYLEERFPAPVLIGETPEERALTRMWTRRIDLSICEPMATGWRFSDGLALFESRIRCLPEAAEGLKAIAHDNLAWLNGQMQGKAYVCGDRFTLADILLFCFVAFGNDRNVPMDTANKTLVEWLGRVEGRPSAQA